MRQAINFKSGDTFSLSGQLLSDGVGSSPVNLSGYTIRSHLKSAGQLVQQFSIAVTDAVNGAYSISATASETADWVIGACEMDIEFTSNTGAVISSETIYINVIQDVTR